jgi:2-polyprenyl-6-methoxyphenol hydroxylase-like FAD-dependent oxidoreductase
VLETEILILGAGPAGSTAARLLAMWGHAVTIVTKPERAGTALAESLTPSCGKFFDLLGISEAIDRAGFVRATGNTVWWGAGERRVEMFANGVRGWQATSTALERVMLAEAERAGARVEPRTLGPDEAAARPAAFRLDCTGRAGLLARSRAGRRMEEGHRTVALAATWQRADGWPLPDPTHTLIESYADGWAWSVPLASTPGLQSQRSVDGVRRAVAVMVDPRTTAMVRGDGARATYLAELEKTARLRPLLAEATLESGPSGWDASMYSSTTYAGPDWLVVGDAASFVDPLSSAGVKKALVSGWLAAIVTHTALKNPSMASTALAFFAEREAEMYADFLGLTRRFLRDAAEGQAHPFWAERAETSEWDDRVDRERHERGAIQAAYDRVRAAQELRVTRGPDVRLEPRPAIAGTEIVLEPRLVTLNNATGVRFLHDIDVVTLVELAPTCGQVPDLYDACVRRVGPMDLAAFLTALATAVARGWLVLAPGNTPPSGP